MPISNQDDGTPYVGVPQGYKVQRGVDQWVTGEYRNPAAGGPDFHSQPIYGVPRYTEQATYGMYSMPGQKVWQWQKSLAQAGLLSTFRPGDPGGSTFSAYKGALAEANRRGMSVEEYLAQRTQANALMARGQTGSSSGGGGGGGGMTSYTSTSSSAQSMTSTSVNLTGRGTAESILRNALLQELGRAPTDKEVGDFKRSLNRSERKNPVVTKSNQSTTTTTSVKGHNSSSSTSGTSSSTTKASDVDPQEQALDYAKEKPLRRERNMYQDSQYYDVLTQMLGM